MTSFLTAKTIIIKKTENGTQTIETTGRQIKMDNTIDFFKENCKNKNTTPRKLPWLGCATIKNGHQKMAKSRIQTNVTNTTLPFRVFQKDSLPPTRFNFFSNETYEKIGGVPAPPIMHFNNCTVYIGSDYNHKDSQVPPSKKRRRVRLISSSDESGED